MLRLASLLLLLCLNVHAGIFELFRSQSPSCEEYNLYEIPASPLQKIPHYIQSSDTCYAHSEYQLLSYHLASGGKDFSELSPVWLAYVFKKKQKDNLNTIGIGNNITAAFNLMELGLCPKSVLEKALSPYIRGHEPLQVLEEILASLDEDFTKASTCQYSPVQQNCSMRQTNIGMEKFAHDFNQHMLNYTYMPILDELFSTCKAASKKITVPSGFNLGAASINSESLATVTNNILKKYKPLVLEVCSQVFTSPGYKRDLNCSRHSTLIVGKRMNNGKCQLLIRDSNVWGTKNTNESSAANPWNFYYDKSGEVMGLWIDQEAISKSFFGLNWLD